WKGYLDIIDAIDRARHEYPQILHLGIGNGPQQEELQQEIDKRGLNDHFILTGWMNRKHVPAIFKLSKGFIHAAQLEPFGFVIAEAMAYKTPMISTKTGAAGDVLENMKSAYLFDYSDISESILKGIRHVLENDPTEMTENAFMAFQNNFQFKKCGQVMLSYLNALQNDKTKHIQH
ncbi:MAG: glycosyltransferase family 4 protein, partial [Flavobacteriales bacterium]|nr:glycosyltransferase family 4 protein [Flavobacteriales bacterium]